jgi:hypothetical protein
LLVQRKVTKRNDNPERPPLRTTKRSPPFLAPPGARQLAGRKIRASGSNTGSLNYSRWGCGTRRALRGSEKTFLSVTPTKPVSWVFKNPLVKPSLACGRSAGPKGRARDRERAHPAQGCAVCAPPEANAARGNRRSRRRPGGVLSLGDFSLHEQREVTLGRGRSIPDSNNTGEARSTEAGAGAEPPAISF